MKSEKIILFLIIIAVASYIIYERVKQNKLTPIIYSPPNVNQSSFVGVPGNLPDYILPSPSDLNNTILYA